MKLYIKNGIIVGTKITSIKTDKGTMLNPTDEFLTENGYEIVNVENNNTDIENIRANAYKNETDILFNRYMKQRLLKINGLLLEIRLKKIILTKKRLILKNCRKGLNLINKKEC